MGLFLDRESVSISLVCSYPFQLGPRSRLAACGWAQGEACFVFICIEGLMTICVWPAGVSCSTRLLALLSLSRPLAFSP